MNKGDQFHAIELGSHAGRRALFGPQSCVSASATKVTAKDSQSNERIFVLTAWQCVVGTSKEK